MVEVTVKKDELLKALKENREKHHKAFLQAQKDYRAAAVIELSKMLAEAKEGKEIRNRTGLADPDDYTGEYGVVIAMAEMSVAEELTLTNREFQQYVCDNWVWSSDFSSSCSSYSSLASGVPATPTRSSLNG